MFMVKNSNEPCLRILTPNEKVKMSIMVSMTPKKAGKIIKLIFVTILLTNKFLAENFATSIIIVR